MNKATLTGVTLALLALAWLGVGCEGDKTYHVYPDAEIPLYAVTDGSNTYVCEYWHEDQDTGRWTLYDGGAVSNVVASFVPWPWFPVVVERVKNAGGGVHDSTSPPPSGPPRPSGPGTPAALGQ